ncbi:hypothetical protein MNBD_BACTEROID01-1285 [hydrothermal vent metagenome]|uniref:Transposase zinc-ribbon domain-containing protein n=1 Tax=hydrothermal vent metagenome TaxID=652676 RepID=A0A3B0UEF7_9ZZZZ
MEDSFSSLTICEFQKRFPDVNACFEYLAELKWGGGFRCPRCGHTNYCNGKRKYDRQCTSCHRISSPTSSTLFHNVKFPILKAFYITYYVSTSKKGVSSTELSRKLGLRQKTCWLFKKKVMKAMERNKNAGVGETAVGGRKEGTGGFRNNKKEFVGFDVKEKGRGGRIHGKLIRHSSEKVAGAFMKTAIELPANIKTDDWIGCSLLQKTNY